MDAFLLPFALCSCAAYSEGGKFLKQIQGLFLPEFSAEDRAAGVSCRNRAEWKWKYLFRRTILETCAFLSGRSSGTAAVAIHFVLLSHDRRRGYQIVLRLRFISRTCSDFSMHYNFYSDRRNFFCIPAISEEKSYQTFSVSFSLG